MSAPQQELNAAELQDLERLVDGELELAAQQQLLQRLEQVPEGWRRCALAFLESQALARELSLPTTRPSDTPVLAGITINDATAQPTVAPVQRQKRVSPVFALAASFLIAFGLGLALRGTILHDPSTGGVPLAESEAESASGDPVAQAAAPPLEHARPVQISPAPSDLKNASPSGAPIRLVGSDKDGRPAGMPRRSLIPPQVRRALERMGHRVEEHLEMLPIELEDGSQGYVPAERIELHYIGNQYQ
ncbi:MAG: hypothetical protein KF708_04080 [Pirellulales bacterium]|nr:hypothetical protein [Pirellulales bacterium]